MRFVRKIFLLALTAVAAMAFAASTASAQETPIEVIDEHSLEHCAPVPNADTGGCRVHFSGELILVGHIFGIEANASDCLVELEARIDEDGEGYVYQASFTPHPTDACTRSPCSLPWRIHGEEPAPGVEHIYAEFCARPDAGGADTRCEVRAPLTAVGDHDYRLTFIDVAGIPHPNDGSQPGCELTGGVLDIEKPTGTHDEIEIIH
jgi:hypothetical protein